MAILGWLERNVVGGRTSLAREVVVTAACVGLATAARWALNPLLGSLLPFATYFPAVLVAGLAGGWRAGMATLLLSSAGGWLLFLTPGRVEVLPRCGSRRSSPSPSPAVSSSPPRPCCATPSPSWWPPRRSGNG